MKLQPIIRSKLAKFRQQHELDSVSDGIAFEMFANKMILCNHQLDAFNVECRLLDAVCVGGENDMGIDGLCIKLNGILLSSLDEARDIFELHREAEIEFIFVQSKYKESFEQKEFASFVNGAEDFLSENHVQPRNEKVDEYLQIKDYLFSDEVIMRWVRNPIVRLYYVVMGEWRNSPHIIATEEQFRGRLRSLNTYGEIFVKYVDASVFKRICDDNENHFKTTLSIIDQFQLTSVDNVDCSLVALVSADQLLGLLKTEDGLMRKNLFEDNVRDFQGDTAINNEIFATIANSPSSFVLLNNGITIVCQEASLRNRTVIIKNPQIVNGCQTCSVIFQAAKSGLDLTEVVVTTKIIATNNDEIANIIVKGTNRQNIVYDEAFEITRDFHKELEDFFVAMNKDGNRIFYERRSRQYADISSITFLEKVNFRILIQSFINVFLSEPHLGHRYQSRLLQDFKNTIFIDAQSKYPYYVACKIHQQFDRYLHSREDARKITTYKMHILLLFKILAVGQSPSINDDKAMENYCRLLLRVLDDRTQVDKYMSEAILTFDRIKKEWISQKGEGYRFGIKDSDKFTIFMMDTISGKQPRLSNQEQGLQCRGVVKKVGFDKKDNIYGFISRRPKDIYFSERYNPSLNYAKLEGKQVLYTTVTNPIGGDYMAKDILVVE